MEQHKSRVQKSHNAKINDAHFNETSRLFYRMDGAAHCLADFIHGNNRCFSSGSS